MSVDARTKGRRLDSYRRQLVDESTLLYDADLLKLPVELTITTGGLFGGRLKAKADGLDGAACPIQLVRETGFDTRPLGKAMGAAT